MTKNLANIRIYGDQDSVVYIADKGSTLPTTLAAPGVAFEDLGWISEDGVDVTREVTATDFTAWQGGFIVHKNARLTAPGAAGAPGAPPVPPVPLPQASPVP
jgi:hypothetical protein